MVNCCNCNKNYDLCNMISLECTDLICKNCFSETDPLVCSICEEERKILPVPLLIARIDM